MKENFKYKAVLFDFDGTLFDTWPALAQALKKTYQNHPGGNIATDHLKKFSTLKRQELLAKLFNRLATKDEINYFIRTYKDLMLRDIISYSGFHETIEFFIKKHIPWGIVTNKPRNYMELFMQHEPALVSVSCLICPEDVANRKPHPEPLRAACKAIHVHPQEVLFIGDSLHDIEAANRCRMDCGLALYGYVGEINDFKHLNINYYIHETLWEIINILSD